jgi:hypothetical protein
MSMLTPSFTPEAVDKVLESYQPFAWFQFLNIVKSRLYHLAYKPDVYFKFLIQKIEDDFIVSYLGTFKICNVANKTGLVSFRYAEKKAIKKMEYSNATDRSN